MQSASGTVTINSQNPGVTPFIAEIHATVSPANALKTVQFTVTPKPGSVTRPISATYTSSYLQSRGYLDLQTGLMTVPVFGLYANYSDTVTLNSIFTDGSSQQNTLTIPTADWNDSCAIYKTPVVIQTRTNSRNLSYDFMLLKNICGSQSPIIMDTDGLVRWVGPSGYGTPSSMFFGNSIYIVSGATTGINRIDFDGTVTPVQDYSSIGVTSTGHHNYDPGKQGMLIEVDTTLWIESVVLEVDAFGNVLHNWNLADIISAAMIAGGDDPNQFVQSGSDWFHNNAATYRASDDSLIISSREDFVIALDYKSGAIKWILGDPMKQWYQFSSLRRYALALGPNTLPPIGQHAVSITKDDNLLLFDDGFQSLHHTPPGLSRSYSAPRKYQINLSTMTATEIWNYPYGQSLFSKICSSVYEDNRLNYLIDYSDIVNLGSSQYAELVGLEPSGAKAFDYRYANSGCSTAWNAIPIHLEQMTFTSVPPLRAVSRKTQGTAGTFDVDLPLSASPGIESRTGNYDIVITFEKSVTVSGATVTPGNGRTANISGPATVNGNNVSVHLINVSNAQTLTVNLTGVNDGMNIDNVPVSMSILFADVTADNAVNSADISATKSQSGTLVGGGNFRADINADGAINSADISLAKSKSGTGLP
ncbi:MAG: aryl-sulfate sulfotransferase [Spartobacteria bacterium]